jgi:hypothetical protein
MRIQSYGTCDLRVSSEKVAELRASLGAVDGLVAKMAQGLIGSVVSTSTAPVKPLSQRVSKFGETAKEGARALLKVFEEAIEVCG